MALDAAALERLRAFAALLVRENARLNLTRITEPGELLEKHLLDALVGAPSLVGDDGAPPDSLVDVGSGGGVPGLPLAALWPEARVLLVEAEGRKAEFLRQAARELALPRVEVTAARAELVGRDPARREAFQTATLRAVGAVPTCLELGLPLVRPGGRLLLYRGPGDGSDELAEATRVACLLAAGVPTAREVTLPSGARRRLILVPKSGPIDERYPRRDGVPSRRPL